MPNTTAAGAAADEDLADDRFALAHGGSVACEPRDGGGSCFRLSLPALPALPAAAVAVAVA